ncbi:unnamed protein product, partial [Rotaria socialis]
CVNTTITPSSCGSSCTVTFYRAGNTYGITLASGNTPIGITGAVTASSAITFGVSNVGGISTVTIARIINNAGIPVTMSRPGSGAITVNLCAPK